MAVVSRRGMANNPYRRQTSPLQNPLIIGGAVVALLIFAISIISAGLGSKDGDGSHQLRNTRVNGNQGDLGGEEVVVKSHEDLNLHQEMPTGKEQKAESHAGQAIHVEPMEEYHFDNVKYYQRYTAGKSGEVIEDMFMLHAHAFHKNAKYGGCCASGKDVQHHETLLDAIGLKDALPFACPKDTKDDGAIKKYIPIEHYHGEDTRTWTPEYVAFLKSLVKYPVKDDNEFVIVVHIRRGEVTPCRRKNKGYDRYLPNKHYMGLIEKYYRPGATVQIISESESFESLDEFREKGYVVDLDGSLESIWRRFVSADVLILSRSDFSMIPAVCAMGQVVYTPFWHHPIRGWDRVENEFMEQTDAENERLRQERCT